MDTLRTKHIAYNVGRRHVDEFLGLHCAADLLTARLFPNGKEITESMGVYNALREHLYIPGRVRFDDSEVTVFVVGDGHMPRTGALIAFRSRWRVYSIDPASRVKGEPGANFTNLGHGIIAKRLTVVKAKIEDCGFCVCEGKVIVVMVHSHATLDNVFAGIKFDTADFVVIPCCVHQPGIGEYIEYEDIDMWTPKNKVIISYDVSGR